MKKQLLILLSLLSMELKAPAQQYFNIRDALHSTTSILTAVLPIDDKYYCTGTCIDSINMQPDGSWILRSGIKFAVYDLFGNKLIDTVYQTPFKNIDPWRNTLYHLGNKNFLLAAECVDTGGANKLMLFKFDSTGYMYWQKEFLKPLCTERNFYKLRDFKQDSLTKEWLLLATGTCSTSTTGIHANMILTKLDSSFNELWSKQYGTAWTDIPSKILIEPNGYILAGGVNNSNVVTKNFNFHAKIICTDTAGNELWTYLSPVTRLTNTIQDIIKTQDGGYVYCGQGDGVEVPHLDGVNAHIVWKGWVEKIDANRNFVWSKSVSNLKASTSSNDQKVLYELVNGSIVMGGMIAGGFGINDTLPINYGSIIKIDANSNTIWQRKYSLPPDTFLYLTYDMKITSDNGFILCGEATDKIYPYSSPTQRGWLIKVDSNGCMSATDLQCHPTNIPQSQEVSPTVQVYPNPVSDVLQVRISRVSSVAAAITIFDLYGRILLSKAITQPHIDISLQNLPSGLYLYKITEGAAITEQGKLTKQQ